MTYSNKIRKDEASEKRVELHCHTNMSFKDGTATADEIIMQACKFGHKAIAITDHGSVRAYPEIYNAVKRIRKEGGNIKPIYGVELYFINDVDNDISNLTEKEIVNSKTHLIVLVKNQRGLKSLYKMMSEAELFLKWNKAPVIKRSSLDKYRKDFIIGSACECGELYRAIISGESDKELEKITSYYDYFEIQPLENNKFIINKSAEPDVYDKKGNIIENRFKRVTDFNAIKDFNKMVVVLADKLKKPVVATGDVHFIEPEDSIIRKILMVNQGYADFEEQAPLYFRTTNEMLSEFSYLGEDKAFEIVIKNTNLIADMVKEIIPFKEDGYPLKNKYDYEDLDRLCREKANELYAKNGVLPNTVKERLDAELHHIISNNFSSHYMVAYLVVKYLKERGEYAFAPGMVGSSFVAYILGITEVNPLEPHYLCPHCHHTEFITDYSVYTGFDLPQKSCPECAVTMKCDGHNIPYEIFMGFHGDKVPDINLNISPAVQAAVFEFLVTFFGKKRVAYASTIYSILPHTAECYIRTYEELTGEKTDPQYRNNLIGKLCNIKTHSGMHPSGIFIAPKNKVFYDFTALSAIDDYYFYEGNIRLTVDKKTVFDFHHLHDTIIKLDILGHSVPDVFKLLEEFTGISPLNVDIKDPEIYKLFSDIRALGITAENVDGISVGTLCLPEYSTDFVRDLLLKTKPQNFTDLVKINGLAHGADVWTNNAENLIDLGERSLSELIALGSDIMIDLIKNGVDKATAYKFDECIRKGLLLKKRLSDEEVASFKEITKHFGDWYFDSCQKIRYMFPKAHAVAHVINALRLAWFKLYYPTEFYAAYFSVYFERNEFNFNVLPEGLAEIDNHLNKMKSIKGEDSCEYRNIYTAMIAAKECISRGVNFLPPDIEKSDPDNYIPENGNIRIPL
ncbi:MAG: PHP domain-containing protein [Clostridia bacterium]|nr:PHP domain-containing protein [Clostridia bacterium]